MEGRQLASKWLKTEALLGNPRVADHIPATRVYNTSNLHQMLNRYGFVVIKPIVGGGGNGVIKITMEGGNYAYTYMANTRSFTGFDEMVRSLSTVKKKRRYIIQRGIRLASISGRPIDYRVKFVKTKGRWVCRGVVGRLARQGLFVTNLCRGGTQLNGSEGIRRSLSGRMVRAKRREMLNISQKCTRILERKYPGIRQLGYDYGIDKSGHIWIFEVNTRPQ
ncbi:YheC/YheD family protein [Paenibacillus thiaminolyticus]|uniref:YheC/YheD family protein n=1 Tax=Paenibacillus thiaminolyticus TaxID=49283 RepID=A0AAP9DY57_PANTH|nr:YheC/YheD family protein [Paenibacillus thiaminolyticus]MCY9536160.1 YheC/YheD family protein [Paenibacillus thiaminolyticus]MCY9603575.1 YheC/YheD family protein [Paenibacillus thiaminolyticus]MCY9605709.1 YheC/YheD family protein [Paenibacillus thiaminolyticus]MCY9611790.1 YheC/YheD family protein [Paenibacillus thiaminolyticus]MCY9621011.1 YheC/YheD family protein [Paenibacillus thiaminolyticus]